MTPPSNPQPPADPADGAAATPAGRGRRCVRAIGFLAWIGGLAALVSVLYDGELVAALRGEEMLVPEAAAALERTGTGLRMLALAAFGVVLALFALDRPKTSRGLGALVSTSILVAVVAVAELVFAPLAPPLTDIFAPHGDRGWALVPGVTDEWMGVPVTINEQGMRGPLRKIPKPTGVQRVLFLGDSVTFGFQLEDDDDTIPAQAEQRLNQLVEPTIEVLNGGVGGYSPWQEVRWLADEGLRFEPDVVVVNFVLNDVSEKLGLERFGGSGAGFQLEHSRAARGLAWRSSTLRYMLRERAAARGADDAFERGSGSAELSVGDLLTRPNASEVRDAWNRTLPELARLVALCRGRKIPVLLVAYPYTIQLERAGLDAPQRRLEAFAAEQGIEFLDLTPYFRAGLDVAGGDLDRLFLDALHLTPEGCTLAGGVIAQVLVDGLYIAR